MALRKAFIATLGFMLLAVAGCASNGKKIDPAMVNTIVVGTTTKTEMLAKFGAPMGQGFDSEGRLGMNWMYVHVPFGGFGMRQQMLSVLFDQNERVAKYSLTDNEGQNSTRLGY